MRAQITNYRGVSAAILEIDKITLVSGPNGSGKSSSCQAVGAALTGEPMPIDDENGNKLAKTKAGVIVRSGTAAGKVELSSSTGTTEIAWPSAKVKASGQAPAASEFAAGLNSIVAMDIKKRIPFLIDYLRAQPSKENLVAALGCLNLGQGTIDNLWELIQTTGWDATYSRVKEKGAKLKGQWELITNANYGAKAAASWIPTGYDPTLEGSSEDTLSAIVTDARDALEASIAASAVDDSRRQDLENLVALQGERQTALELAKTPLPEDAALKDVTGKLADAKAEVTKAQQDLNALRAKAPVAGTPPRKLYCTCGKELMQDSMGNLCDYKTSGPDQATIDAHAVKVSDAVKIVNEKTKLVEPIEAEHVRLSGARQAVVNQWNQDITECSRKVAECITARNELDKMGAPSTAQAGASVEQCRNDLAAHELRLKAFTSKRDADSIHRNIELNQALLKHIAPTGVRADVLTAALGEFNKILLQLSGTASWAPVEITPDFQFSFKGTPYFLLSSAEQYRVRVIVQVAMAMREKSAMIVVDGADILDKGGRNGLFRLLHSTGIPALVGMTIDAEENVPNLTKAGLGRSYWLGASVAKEIV